MKYIAFALIVMTLIVAGIYLLTHQYPGIGKGLLVAAIFYCFIAHPDQK